MARRLLALDPGTRNTGYCVLVEHEGWVTIFECGTITTPKKYKTSMEKFQYVVTTTQSLLTGLYPRINELWPELFVPFGGRTNMMECISTIGGILAVPTLLPIGRKKGTLPKDFQVRGVESHRWKKFLKEGDKKLTHKKILEWVDRLDIDSTTVDLESLDDHALDALGIGIYAFVQNESSESWSI